MGEKKQEKHYFNKIQVNENIVYDEIQVISETNKNLGIMKKDDALAYARSLDLDLVSINLSNNPKIFKVLNYDNYRYELKKKEKQRSKLQREQIQKEKTISLSVNIGQHDLETKSRKAEQFLKGGDKVKVEIRFRGREIQHAELGIEKIKSFCSMLKEHGTLEKEWYKYKLEGNFFRVTLISNYKKQIKKLVN